MQPRYAGSTQRKGFYDNTTFIVTLSLVAANIFIITASPTASGIAKV